MATGPVKRAMLFRLLARGIATVHLDARHEGVRVPLDLRDADNVSLNLSWRYPAARLFLDDEEVCATLSFQGKPYRCIVPWAAVFGITAPGKGEVWLEDVPASMLAHIAARAELAWERRRPKRLQGLRN